MVQTMLPRAMRLGTRVRSWEGLVQGRCPVSVQVVQDQPHHLGFRVGFTRTTPARSGGRQSRCIDVRPLGDRHMPASAGQEAHQARNTVAGALPPVLVVLARWISARAGLAAGAGWEVSQQLGGGLVKAQTGTGRCAGHRVRRRGSSTSSMWATNSALTLGMHHRPCFCHGLRAFFDQVHPHRLAGIGMAPTLSTPPLCLRQKAQGPVFMPFRRLNGAGQGDEVRLRPGRPASGTDGSWRPVFQHPFQPRYSAKRRLIPEIPCPRPHARSKALPPPEGSGPSLHRWLDAGSRARMITPDGLSRGPCTNQDAGVGPAVPAVSPTPYFGFCRQR